MRKIGAHVSSDGGPINAIENILEIGGNCLQIFAGSPRMWQRSLYDNGISAEFRRLKAQHALDPVFIHALYLTNLASDDGEIRQKSKQALIMDMRNCALLGAAGVVLHIGSHQGRGFDAVKKLLADEIGEVLSRTPPESHLLLENAAGQRGKIGTLPELAFLIDQINDARLLACLDSAHAFSAGYDLRVDQGIDKLVTDIQDSVTVDKIGLLHLNDSKVDLGAGNDRHENLGDGFIGLSGLKNFVTTPLLSQLPIVLEVPGFGQTKAPDKENIEIAKSLIN